jgi:hypothetical protein
VNSRDAVDISITAACSSSRAAIRSRFFIGIVAFVIGTFPSSGVLHPIAIVSLNDQPESRRILIGYGMMAPVIFAERAFKQFTGRRLGVVVVGSGR